ncbi:hypothetical protein NLM24_00020 [Nocardia zapadnayensis]|uniref:hypothetical protein n=1 Tax=Nocardia rhamnosiphila TaxID=426716 RepID=UPI0022461F33|nr:hypothetical protein [Nocardia zapadnayensis]MCX0269126.1 hypothetical protein [Nocardia zapadnayensis]
MKVILFGGTGMIGQGVLDECLLDARVTQVLTVGRNPLGISNPELRELVQPDPADLSAIADELVDERGLHPVHGCVLWFARG